MTVEARSVRKPAPRAMLGRSNWWVQPVVTAVVFTAFIIYAGWSVLFGSNHSSWVQGPYLSPFYSPVIPLGWWPLSSAIMVAWFPLGFRATSYYYRKANYFITTGICTSASARF